MNSYLKLILLLAIILTYNCMSTACAIPKRNFGYNKQEIIEFKNTTSHLNVCDINNDGLDDIIFLNNSASRVEILISKKEGFDNKGFVLDQWSRSFRIADINGDKKLDLIFVGNHLGLQVYLQTAKFGFKNPINIYVENPSKLIDFEAEDINNDGFYEILLCRQTHIDIVTNKKGNLSIGEPLYFASKNICKGVEPIDVDGDGFVDLAVLFANTDYPLSLYKNSGDGNFYWSMTLKTPPIRALKKLPFKNKDILGVILKNSQVVRLYIAKFTNQTFTLKDKLANPIHVPLKGMDYVKHFSYLKNNDLLIINTPQLSQLQLFYRNNKYVLSKPVFIDTLKDVTQLAKLKDNKIAVLSDTENAIAIHNLNQKTTFPDYLHLDGKPVAIDSFKESLIAIICKNKSYSLVEFDSNLKIKNTVQINLDNNPQDMSIIPIGNSYGIMIFRDYDTPQFYIKQKLKFKKIDSDNFRALASNLTKTDIYIVNNNNFIISEGNVVRKYSFAHNSFKVIQQFNPQRPQAHLVAPIMHNGNLVVYDQSKGDLLVFNLQANTVSSIQLLGGGDGLQSICYLNNDLILMKDKELLLLPAQANGIKLNKLAEYTTKQNNPGLWNLSAVDLGNNKGNGIAVLDYKNHTVELLQYNKNQLHLGVAFEVFQDAGFNEANNTYEPRSVCSGDCNGDGLGDLIFLVHNKLLIHYGE